jgi:hypothetical protein
MMMEEVRTSETSVDNQFTRQYIPEDNSEHHTRRRENLKSHIKNINHYRKGTNEAIHMAVCDALADKAAVGKYKVVHMQAAQ